MAKQDSVAAETVRKLNRQWMEAYTKRDAEFLARYMSEDYVGTFPDGTVHDKRSEIEGLMSGAIAITEMEPSEMTVRMYGNTAVLTGQSRITATVAGREMSDEFRFTDVWIRSGEHWQAVASQVTRIDRG